MVEMWKGTGVPLMGTKTASREKSTNMRLRRTSRGYSRGCLYTSTSVTSSSSSSSAPPTSRDRSSLRLA